MSIVSVTEAVQIAMQDLESKIDESGAQIKIGVVPDVYGNLSYLSHLFLNLISNSIKFSNGRPIINIWGEAHAGVASIYIEDNGIGIEEEGHQKIFHAFQKMHGKNEYEGSGLGLAICKRIVDIHHGHLSVSSVVGEGSTFVVDLPSKAGGILS